MDPVLLKSFPVVTSLVVKPTSQVIEVQNTLYTQVGLIANIILIVWY